MKYLADDNVQSTPTKERYKESLTSSIVHAKSAAPVAPESWNAHMRSLGHSNSQIQKELSRPISKAPIRSLDAPEAVDDFYSHTLDWSSKNVIAVALGPSVYLYNAETCDVDSFMTLDNGANVSSLRWIQGGQYLAIGSDDSELKMWDVKKGRAVRSLSGHSSKITALSWNKYILSSGSEEGLLYDSDVRAREHRVLDRDGHSQAITGLAWSPDGQTLASGSNDNTVMLWSANNEPKVLNEHVAGVRALAWAPRRNVLATGGGNGDNTIKIWNTSADHHVMDTIHTDSQVCSLQWGRHHDEILSTHGYSSNSIRLWKYPSNIQMCDLRSHTSRVLHSSVSPDGRTVCTMGGERLYFWDMWAQGDSKGGSRTLGNTSHSNRGFMRGLDMR
ncbi:Cdc20 [Carpediemonas membranifera]|uniref:Cdc20 n=1 Tax=Carpediemonas membranifera TaxID=201153 RepID=A0A8J6BWV5_9EUKA|nr:Cdc20 [Carpediemonas membranifera]|eukprot:KAG9392811.1 Cdc20 [Carpediemonas membranifera]